MLWAYSLFNGQKFFIHGISVIVPKSVDLNIRYAIMRRRPYEEGEVELCRKALKHGHNVLELGGSVGVVSALIRSIIGPNAMHVIVEADHELSKVCLANANAGANQGRVKVINAAIDYTGRKSVNFESGHNSHTGKVSDENSGTHVQAITASECLDAFNGKSFALVCDIEGAEVSLLENDGRLFERCHTIIMETHPNFYQSGDDEVLKIEAQLKGLGYSFVDRVGDVVLYARAHGD